MKDQAEQTMCVKATLAIVLASLGTSIGRGKHCPHRWTDATIDITRRRSIMLLLRRVVCRWLRRRWLLRLRWAGRGAGVRAAARTLLALLLLLLRAAACVREPNLMQRSTAARLVCLHLVYLLRQRVHRHLGKAAGFASCRVAMTVRHGVHGCRGSHQHGLRMCLKPTKLWTRCSDVPCLYLYLLLCQADPLAKRTAHLLRRKLHDCMHACDKHK